MLTSIKQIEKKYNTYLIDVVGVIHNENHPIKEAITAINYLLKKNKNIIFVSNNPRPSSDIQKKIKKCGIIGSYRTVTSGDVMHYIITHELSTKNIYHLGRTNGSKLLENMKLKLTSSISDADAILIACSVKKEQDIHIFDNELRHIYDLQKPSYCANPDTITWNASQKIFLSGYFAHKLRMMGGTVIDFGKPSPIIYNFISHAHPDIKLQKSITLMIGDTLETDIVGATNFGIDSLLVLSGVSGKKTHLSHTYHCQPTYIMQTLTP